MNIVKLIKKKYYRYKELRFVQDIILLNSLHCNVCNTTIKSTFRWDYVSCNCKTEDTQIAVDGGLDYLRRNVSSNADYTNKSITVYSSIKNITDKEFTILSEHLTWGSRGKDGSSEPLVRTISELSNEHIKNILLTQTRIRLLRRETFKNVLKQRKKNNIVIEYKE